MSSSIWTDRQARETERRNLFLALAALIYTGFLAVCMAFTADDALIVLRYAANLISYRQWVFNPGERICALTSPLHGLLSAALFPLFRENLFGYKLPAIAVVLGALFAAWRSLRAYPAEAALFVVLTLLSPQTVVWTVGGLETPYLLALITGLVLLARREDEQGSAGRRSLLSLLIGLAFLTRYDSLVFTLPLIGTLIARGRGKPGEWVRLLPGLLLALGWLWFARFYFGDIFPTSFYRKTPLIGPRAYPANLFYELEFLVVSGLAVLLLPLLAAWRREPSSREAIVRQMRAESWLTAGLGLFLIYGLTAVTTHMMFAYRFLVPYLPAMTLALLRLDRARREAEGGAETGRRRPPYRLLAWQIAVLGLLYFRGVNLTRQYEYVHEGLRNYVTAFVPAMERNADDLRRHWERQPESRVRWPRVATYAAGVLPFRDRQTVILESLVSYRHRCQPVKDGVGSADYIHLITPRHGTLAHQLPGPLSAYARISSYAIVFDGKQERFEVYYCPHPAPYTLPAHIGDPCRK
jgi:hypothetical protein